MESTTTLDGLLGILALGICCAGLILLLTGVKALGKKP